MTTLQTLPKIANCKDCGKKPKEEIVSFGFTDKDDELFLVHWCKGVHVRFPKRDTFTAHYVNGQRPLVREAWNKNQEVA